MTEEYLTYGHRLEQHIADTTTMTAPAARRRRARPLRGRAGHAARHRPRHLSVRDLLEPGRRRRLRRRRRRPEGHRRGLGRHQGLRDARRRRPVPDRARRRARREHPPDAAASSARRPAARAAPAGSTSSRCSYAARVNGLTAPGGHQARRADRPAAAVRRARATAARTRRCFETYPYHQSVLHHVARRVRGAARLDRGHHRGAQRGRPARRRPASTSTTSRTSSACRSR